MSWVSATRGAESRHGACLLRLPSIPAASARWPTSHCPARVMIHIGSDDSHIGQDQIDAVKAAHPDVPLYLYAGCGHGFYNSHRAEYNEAQAQSSP